MKKSILFIVALSFILTQSCIRDQGNYDYLDINELQFVGFQTANGVDVLMGQSPTSPINIDNPEERFTFIPVIRTSMETEENLVFSWLTMDTLSQRTTFHEGRNFVDTVFPRHWSGDPWLVFRIEDTVSRKILDTRLFVNAINPFESGLMVLQEDANGYMRLDMLSWRPGIWQSEADDGRFGYSHMTNVLENTDFPRQRGARRIVTFSDHIQSVAFGRRAIYIVTDDVDVYRLHPETFEWTGEAGHLRNAFLSPAFFPPNNSRVSSIFVDGPASTVAMLNMEGRLFQQAMGRFFSVELNTRPNRERFTASPHISFVGQRYLVFDEDTRSFYGLLPAQNSWSIPLPESAETYTSFRNMGMNLVFSQAATTSVGAATAEQHVSYNILREDANPDNFWILGLVMENWTQNAWHQITNAPNGFENALMAVGGEFVDRRMYVAINNVVFIYDVPNRSFQPALTLPPGEEITYIGFVRNTRYFGPNDDGYHGFDAHRLLLVASFNPATGGTLAHYSIPLVPGVGLQPYVNSRTRQRHQWTGFGRITDVFDR